MRIEEVLFSIALLALVFGVFGFVSVGGVLLLVGVGVLEFSVLLGLVLTVVSTVSVASVFGSFKYFVEPLDE